MRKSAIYFLFLVSATFINFYSCREAEKPGKVFHVINVDPGFGPYIEEYSSGIVPANSSFKVKLTTAVATSAGRKIKGSDLSKMFSIDPSVKGECIYNEGVFTFKPKEYLKDETEYKVTFYLKNIFDVPKQYEEFKFNTLTPKKDFSVFLEGLRTNSAALENLYSLDGSILSSIPLKSEDIEKIISAEQEGNRLEIHWDHNNENRHLFSIKNIRRENQASTVEFSWDGKEIGINKKGKEKIEIPALHVFKLIGTNVVHQPEQQVRLYFSDPINKKQDMAGLVEIRGSRDSEISVDGNELTLYLKERLIGSHDLIIDKNINNDKGESLQNQISIKTDFQLLKPELRLPGRGVIMPDNGTVIFPFESVNLKAVDLRIVKIFPSNIASFLQQGSLSATYNMRQVGKLIYSKRIDLMSNGPVNLNKWNAFSIDLSKYITIEKGAIYNVEIGMQKAYSLYECSENPIKEADITYDSNKALENEKLSWEDPDNENDGYEDRYYNWELHGNPCSNAYFVDRNIKRNIMVSNIGLTAKKGISDEILVVCSDLQTVLPLKGVKLEIFNYQLQSIVTGESDDQGFCSLHNSEKPFLLIASWNGQKSYLKLNDANALSLSQFDVGGEKIQKGIKAFIYTERGVWRPGDSIYTSVMIEDKYAPLPDKHPVIFKLINPKGQIIQEQIQSLTNLRLLTFRTATSPEAETGPWKALISIGGAEFSKQLRIETIKPNRLKIDFSTKDEVIKGEDLFATGRIQSSWLTGIKASKLRTIVDLNLRAGQTKFENFPLYCFDDATKTFKYETKTLLDVKSDEDGNLPLPLQFGKINDAPGMLEADFTIRVFEPGGDASIRQFTKKYSPYIKYAGLFIGRAGENKEYIKVDENSILKVVAVNSSGEATADWLKVMIYKMQWRWWWESSDQNIGTYISKNNLNLVKSIPVEIKGGSVSLNNVFKELDWGRYFVVVISSSGHSGSQTVYNKPEYYGGGSSTQATMLSFTSDKKKYTTGDNIHISFPAPDDGSALITVENGIGILDKFWVKTKAGNNDLKIKATGSMAPCSYVHISLIQPFGQKNNDNPIRMYGVIPIPVENPDTRLFPVLQIPGEFRPERQISLVVGEKNGQPMNYTIAMVDEGLLDLTGFRTPDPWSGIYQREALGVKTWDLYDEVLGAFGGRLEKLFAIGGDMNPIDPTKNRASRFKPVVRFAGPFKLEKGQTRKHVLDIPAYTGSVRTMIIAGNDGSYGTVEKTSAVKNPLMLLPVAPRALGFDEEVTIPISVFAQDASIKNVKITIECSEHFTILSSKEVNLNFSEVGEKGTEFRVKTSELAGDGTIILKGMSGNESTKYELNIPVRSKEMPVSKNVSRLLNPGEQSDYKLVPFGVKGSNKGVVTVSGLPSINLNSRLNYLITYPHGCTEQTISSVFPQLYLSAIQNLNNVQKSGIIQNVQAAISKLKMHQNTDGSFGFWPGSASNDGWLTNYAGHFLFEAEMKGFSIPEQMKKSWIDYQSRIASDWKGTYAYEKVVQAYRLYSLALFNKPSFSAMNRLREDKTLPQAGRWFLAGAYAETGRPEAAYEMINMRDLNPSEDFNFYTYGDQTRDKAMLLLCMVRMNEKDNMFTLYQQIANKLNSEEWMNTQTTSFALIAVSKAMEKMKAGEKGLSYLLTIDNKSNEIIKSSSQLSTALTTDLRIEEEVSIKNNSQGTIYVNYYTEGIPKKGESVKTDRNLETNVKFLNKDYAPMEIANLQQGTDLIAVVQVKNSSMESVSDCALTFQVPSGWEIRNTRLFNQTTAINEDAFDYRDYRDDKVCTYFKLERGQTKTFLMILNASYIGKYYFPNIQTEAMYDKKYLSLIPGRWVEVRKQTVNGCPLVIKK